MMAKIVKLPLLLRCCTVSVVVVLAGNFILHFCFTQFALLQWMWRSFLTHLVALDKKITWT